MSTNTTDRLQSIETELRSILQERITELMQSVRGAEEASRQIVSTEMEIVQNRQLRESLENKIERMRGDVTALRGRIDEAQRAHEGLFSERDDLRNALRNLDNEVLNARREVADSRSQIARLQREESSLREETSSLEAKLASLRENVNRMKKLREELLSSINTIGIEDRE